VNVGRDEDDIREIAPDPFPPTFYYDYLNSPKLQAAIGASTNWSAASGAVFVAFNSTGDCSRDGMILIIPALKAVRARHHSHALRRRGRRLIRYDDGEAAD